MSSDAASIAGDFGRSDPPSTDGAPHGRWRVAIDTGGTFTDAIAIAPNGAVRRAKVPSDGALKVRASGERGARSLRLELPSWLPAPERFLPRCRLRTTEGDLPIETCDADGACRLATSLPVRLDGAPAAIATDLDAPLLAVHVLVGAAPGDALPPMELRLATTRGTNALLEGRGARVGLVVSRGFGDLLLIGDQSRPQLFATSIVKHQPLAAATVAINERRLADGSVRAAPRRDDVRAAAATLRAAGVTSVAISFLHALRDPAHERVVADWLREEGFADAVCASALSDSPRYLTRCETAVAHAAVTPVIRAFLDDVAKHVPRERTFMLTSGGGVQRAERFLARDSLLSGPAGGLVGVAAAARRCGIAKVLGLDMGGTSADVARFDGEFRYRFETRVGAARVASPSLAIESVAAGGGSICRVHRGELRVGPDSAGARPGPACYGFGGPLTLTDVNLLLGRMDPSRTIVPLSIAAAESVFESVRRDAERQRGRPIERDDLLRGFLAVADERMAGAIEAVSLREGEDPREYALVPFGGAGGQHACALAERLGMSSILFPADAGVLSARGLLGTSVERIARRAVLAPLGSVASMLDPWMRALQSSAAEAVRADVGLGVSDGDEPNAQAAIVEGPCTAAVKLVGQDRPLEIPFGDAAALRAGFAAAFRRLYGYAPPERELEVEALTAVMRATAPLVVEPQRSPREARSRSLGAMQVWERVDLPKGQRIEGPALLVDDGSTAYLAEGWSAEALPGGDVLASRGASAARRGDAASADVDLFACRLEAIALGMGEALQRTALSTNVKERLDYSCAILDRDGQLAVNAPHLPVHLGALGACVRGVTTTLELRPGDVAVTNHPAFGGSHLPDVTVITPVFAGTELLAYVANRAHHAEIGGTRPGSFPPSATCLVEEGVVIAPTLLVERGQPRLDRIEALLRGGPYPSRGVEENLADLQAAIAANAHGAALVARLAERYGADGLARRFAAVLDRAEHAMRATLAARGPRETRAVEHLDDGTPIAVRVSIGSDGRAVIDFEGSGPERRDSFNAPLAVVRAATLYGLRLMIGEDVPMNEGLLRRVDLRVPHSLLNPRFDADPRRCPPVVAGNTETSQRVTDVLLKAFGLAACSQGTMNNLLFGNERFGAYETICGGSGATAQAGGADAVHTHMTNTRITDPEVFERRAPVIVRRFAVRRGSGGRGRSRGGDGAVREIEFREPVQVSLLAQHRVERPFGVDGGEPGAVGRQWIERANGTREVIGGVCAIDLGAGDAIVVETPGGGAWGTVESGAAGPVAAVPPTQ
ncbi:MAG: hydantoinase B/oxoprolinase family protein [Phycisphaerales bacterium]